MNTIKEEIFKSLPRVVYKYRHWREAFHPTILTHNQIFFPKPKHLNDPHDCNYPLHYDLLEPEEMQELVLRVLVRARPNWNDEFILDEANRLWDRGHLTDKEYLRRFCEQATERYREAMGIFSTSRTNCCDVMWAHYGKDHSGFCVGLDTRALFDDTGGRIGEVDYVTQKQIIKPTGDGRDLDRRVNLKNERWSYEQEVRISKTFPEPGDDEKRLIRLRSPTIREVCLGYKIQPDHEQAILATLQSREDLRHVKVFKMYLDPQHFEVVAREIP